MSATHCNICGMDWIYHGTTCVAGGQEPERSLAQAPGSATWIVHTPTGPVHACDRHAAKIEALMGFLGAYTNRTRAAEGHQCSNCLHELRQKHRSEQRRENPMSQSTPETVERPANPPSARLIGSDVRPTAREIYLQHRRNRRYANRLRKAGAQENGRCPTCTQRGSIIRVHRTADGGEIVWTCNVPGCSNNPKHRAEARRIKPMTTKNAENTEKPQTTVASSGWFCRLQRWMVRRDISRALKCCQEAKLGAYAHSEKAADYLIEAESYMRSARALLRQN